MADRPGSKSKPGSRGLAVSGSAPPTRHGTSSSRAGTGSRTAKLMESPLGALASRLILKMRARFGDVAADVKGQEIITKEVMAFMSKGAVKEEDLVELQERIRARLTGSTPIANTLSQEKRVQLEGDEWAKIFEYSIQKGLMKEKEEQELQKQKQRMLRQSLEAQMKEQEARRRAEHEEEVNYFNQEQSALKEWERQEEARKQLQAQILSKLKQEREEQLMDKAARKERALQRVRHDEESLASKISHETKVEFEKEEANRLQAKRALKEFMLQNEINKQHKEQLKQQQWLEDQKFKQQWEAILDKQERERTTRLEKLKAIQSHQAEIAATRPEAKRWLDQSIIDRHYKEREEAREREEVSRQARVREGGKLMAQRLAEQIKEQQALKEEQRRKEEEHAQQMLQRVAEAELRDQERRRREQEKKLKFRAELEAQMKENAVRRRVAPMSDTEKSINTKLLIKVHDFEQTGRIDTEPLLGGLPGL